MHHSPQDQNQSSEINQLFSWLSHKARPGIEIVTTIFFDTLFVIISYKIMVIAFTVVEKHGLIGADKDFFYAIKDLLHRFTIIGLYLFFIKDLINTLMDNLSELALKIKNFFILFKKNE